MTEAANICKKMYKLSPDCLERFNARLYSSWRLTARVSPKAAR